MRSRCRLRIASYDYRYEGRRGYGFAFGGCEWTFFVSGEPVDVMKGIGIQPDGSAVFGVSLASDTFTADGLRDARDRRDQRPRRPSSTP